MQFQIVWSLCISDDWAVWTIRYPKKL